MAAAWEAGDEAAFPAMSPEVEGGELSDDLMDKQNGLKQAGSEALEEGNKDLALEKFSEAIGLGAASAMLLTRRAQLLAQMDRPRAAVNDCNAALVVNPDSAKAFKIRAKAYVKLDMLEEAHFDFQTALKIDFDDDTEEASLEVAAKVKEMQASKVSDRNKAEAEEQYKVNMENKRKYEEGLKANEEKYREERMKEEAEKKQKEDDRKERVRKREQEEGGAAAEGEAEEGVPKSHAPPEPAAAAPTGSGAEDVD